MADRDDDVVILQSAGTVDLVRDTDVGAAGTKYLVRVGAWLSFSTSDLAGIQAHAGSLAALDSYMAGLAAPVASWWASHASGTREAQRVAFLGVHAGVACKAAVTIEEWFTVAEMSDAVAHSTNLAALDAWMAAQTSGSPSRADWWGALSGAVQANVLALIQEQDV